MIQIGIKQVLVVVKKADFGLYLDSANPTGEAVLLPKKQVPAGTDIGSEIEVFVYRDSEDRLIATVNAPKLMLGEIGKLQVVSTTRIGAFLDWGLEKDLFLPFTEQKGTIKEGKSYLVAVYVDKSNRLCATMKVYDRLHTHHDYKIGDEVTGTIYEIHPELGVFVAIDREVHGMIQKKDFFNDYKVGDDVTGRITKIRDDGKIVLSLKKAAHEEIPIDAELILSKIDENNGLLYLNDNSAPDVIKGYLHISKKAFKRAVGNLLKRNLIEITEEGMKRKTVENQKIE